MSDYQDIPEPVPISVDAATDEQARKFLRDITLGRIDRNALNSRLSAMLPESGIAAGAERAAALGAPEAMFAFEQRVTAEGVATYYRVQYPSDIWTWVFSLDQAGSINGFSLRHRRHKIFDVWLRNVTY